MTSEAPACPLVQAGAGSRGRKNKIALHFRCCRSSVTHNFRPHLSPFSLFEVTEISPLRTITMASQVINVTLPALPQGWSAEKDFTAVGTLSATTQRNLEPVGPHFLAHARRVSILIFFTAIFVMIVQTNRFTEAPPPYFLRG